MSKVTHKELTEAEGKPRSFWPQNLRFRANICNMGSPDLFPGLLQGPEGVTGVRVPGIGLKDREK